jgi:hypothetical protein
MRPGRKKGTPKTGGRRKGTPNKVTAEVREVASQHSETAVAELARLMVEGQSEQVRVAACREILDRAHGKSRQSVEHTGHGAGPIAVKELPDKEKMRRLATFLLQDGIVTLDGGSKGRALNYSGITKFGSLGDKGIKDDGENS